MRKNKYLNIYKDTPVNIYCVYMRVQGVEAVVVDLGEGAGEAEAGLEVNNAKSISNLIILYFKSKIVK